MMQMYAIFGCDGVILLENPDTTNFYVFIIFSNLYFFSTLKLNPMYN